MMTTAQTPHTPANSKQKNIWKTPSAFAIRILVVLVLTLNSSIGEASKLFWIRTITTGTSEVWTANLDGSDRQVSMTIEGHGSRQPALTIADNKVYWGYAGQIFRANLDFTNVENLIQLTSSNPWYLGVGANRIYASAQDNNGSGEIWTANMDGSGAAIIVNPFNCDTFGIDATNSKLYWASDCFSGRKIHETDLDGLNRKDIITLNDGRPTSLAVVGNTIFWVNHDAGKIQRANLDGSNVEDLVTGLGTATTIGLAVNVKDEKLYWTHTSGKIQRANFDGTIVEDVLTGMSGLGQIAVHLSDFAVIDGKVTDATTDEPLEALVVAWNPDTPMATFSAGNGEYRLDVLQGRYLMLSFTFGYKLAVRFVDIGPGESKTVDFALTQLGRGERQEIPAKYQRIIDNARKNLVKAAPSRPSPTKQKLTTTWGAIKAR